MLAVENLIVMGLEVGIEATHSDPEPEADTAAMAERDVAVLALVERFGVEGLIESLQCAAESAADAHDEDAEQRGNVRKLRAFAGSLASAVLSCKVRA